MLGLTNSIVVQGSTGDSVDKVIANNSIPGVLALEDKVLLKKFSTEFLGYNELPVTTGNTAQYTISYQNIIGNNLLLNAQYVSNKRYMT